ncbi:SAM-dependent DNA methyltransferase [Leucobacter luti]|uniref:SAM-dependent DNA methyltransferase n=1 Tax=Leucobacter luti TaxID=340320 RepID=UPI001C69011B|nr:SAM-dependent DNA methyltransferase [Leucobacter luti]QYM76871.1 SAM-dependent DNA methyltransferase [Leucobacter luti]
MTGAKMSGSVMAEPRHIKSRERVRDLGEVYTQPREVNAMLDLIPDAFVEIDTRFLEPAAGDGNFLVAILDRKIALIDERKFGGTADWFEFALLRCVASIYAVDIDEQNVHEARERMLAMITAAAAFDDGDASESFRRAAREILRTNIVVGDSLNGAEQIVFIEYSPLSGERFQRVPSELEAPAMDLFYEPPVPLPTVHFSEMGA